MLFPYGTHTIRMLRSFCRKFDFRKKKYAIPTLKLKPIAAGAPGKPAGRVFWTIPFLREKLTGSLTVEAALALPLCLGALMALGGLIQALSAAEQVDHHLCMTARKVAARSISQDGISQGEVVRYFYEGVAENGWKMQSISGGAAGIALSLTDNPDSGLFSIRAAYRFRLPGIFGMLFTIPGSDVVYGRIWTGIELGEGTGGEGDNTGPGRVYVAENGVVYHTDEHCTYLDLSIRAVSASSLPYKRNLYGSRYVPCSKCGGNCEGTVYITSQGEAWHSDPECSGLKRTIELQEEEEAHEHGLRPCPRCGGGS